MDALPGMGLPAGWASATLGELCDVIGGITVDAKRGGPGHVEVPYLRVANVQRGRLDLAKMRTILVPEAKLEALTLQHGDVLLNEGGDRDKVGRGWVWEDQLPQCVFQNHVFRARVRDDVVCPYFLSLYLNEFGRDYFLTGAKQTTNLASISLSAVKGAPVVVPPRAEQDRIVAAVNTLFEEVEAGEAALARAREGLTQFRASLLHAASTGALTADWRAANPTNQTGGDLLADVLAKRRIRWAEGYRAAAEARGRRLDGEAWLARYPQPQPATGDELVPLPHGWAWASLDQLCVTMTSGSRAWAPYYDRGTSVFVMAQNVRPGRFDRSFVQLVDPPQEDPERIRTRIQRDDLLVTIVGANTGDVCRVDADVVDHYVCQSVALMRPVRADLAEYLDLFLNSERGGQAAFARMMYGAGRPHLSFDQLKSVAVPLPPPAEIAAILHAVREAWIESDALMPEGFASSLRRSILHAAFTGRLVPQDPADEPASALLARLRAAPATARRPRARHTATQPELIETPG